MNNIQYKSFVEECTKDFKHESEHMTILYLTMGLCEEIKEFKDKLKDVCGIHELVSEAGDITWFTQALINRFGTIKPQNTNNLDLGDVGIDVLSIIKKAVFFGDFSDDTKTNLVSLLSNIPDLIITTMGVNGYNTTIATIYHANRLKLEARYGVVRKTSYINKDVKSEDLKILEFIKKQKQCLK